MAESRIRIKIGNIEIEHEGTEAFIKAELPELVKAFSSLKDAGILPVSDEVQIPLPLEIRQAAGGQLQMTTGNIAAKINASNGKELILAAAAHLHFVRGKAEFDTKELLAEMKSATSFFDQNMGKNIGQNLKSLVKGDQINELRKGVFALTNGSIGDLSSRLT